jgi:hypothetical protein
MNQRDSAGSAVMRLDTVEIYLKIMGIGNWGAKVAGSDQTEGNDRRGQDS